MPTQPQGGCIPILRTSPVRTAIIRGRYHRRVPAKLDLLRTHRSQFAKTVVEFGVLTHGVGDYLFGLESRDRYFGSLIGVRYGEALVADRPLRLAGMGDILALLC